MLLRNTKKFFQKTIDGVKSFLSGGYQRLPKSPPCNPLPCSGGMDLKYSQSYRELDKVYTEFTNQWDDNIDAEKTINSSCKKKDSSNTVSRFDDRVRDNLIKHAKSSPSKNYNQVVTKGVPKNRKILYEGKRYKDLAMSKGVREKRGLLVAKKLKELEMLDKTNVEHVLDIEEILHYYSRLTCPAYLDIVESFFMEMYSELLSTTAGQAPSSRVNNPWPLQLQSTTTIRF